MLILKESKKNNLAILEIKGVEIANNFPGDNNLLLEKQQAFITLWDTLEEAVERHKIKGKLKENYNIIDNEKSY